MKYKIFYAYQSDIPKEYGDAFIEGALDKATERILKEQKIKVEVIKGFQDTPGNTVLIDEMLRRSRDADIVLVDLTITSSKIWNQGRIIPIGKWKEIRILNKGEDKVSPNPNVLLETGYAWALKGSFRTILVMNEAYGSAEKLPVDLKGFRWPIRYNLNRHNFQDAERQKNRLANSFYEAITNAIQSESDYQREKWSPLRLWADWTPQDFRNKYIVTPTIKSIIPKLRTALENPNNPQRIVGPSNSGKTRLAYELYKKNHNSIKLQDNLNQVLYYDLKDGSYPQIEGKLLELKIANQKKILIIDNCPHDIHKKIWNEFTAQTNVSLLTIEKHSTNGQGTVYLDVTTTDEIIKGFSALLGRPEIISEVIEESGRNLRNAFAIIHALQKGQVKLPEDYMEKWSQILGAKYLNNGALSVLEHLSLFTHVGYSGQFSDESELIRLGAKVPSKEVYSDIINHLSQNGLIRVIGDFIVLETFIEELSVTRIQQLKEGNIDEYLLKITEHKMSQQFSDRILELHTKRSYKYPIIDLIETSGIFSNIQFITTSEGGKLQMVLSETRPEFILNNLEKILASDNSEELITSVSGRRYLVWTLEKIVFRKNFFTRAASILFNLAASENEAISNNATSIFQHLFHFLLAGTEATLEERLDFLTTISINLNSENEILTFKGTLYQALATNGFIRMGSAGEQDGQSFTDYFPKSKEISAYQAGIIDLLVKQEMFDVITSRLANHVVFGNTEAIKNAVEKIINIQGNMSTDMRLLLQSLANDPNSFSHSISSWATGILNNYNNQTVAENLKFLVALAPYSTYKDNDGNLINKSKEKAVELAAIVCQNTDWFNDVKILLVGDQHQTYNFGYAVAKIIGPNEDLIDKIITFLMEISPEERNPNLITGYLAGGNDDAFTRYVIKKFLENEGTAPFCTRLTALLIVQKEDVEILKPLIQNKPEYVVELDQLVVTHWPDNDLADFVLWVSNITPYGKWAAINIYSGTVSENLPVTEKMLSVFEILLSQNGLLKSEDKYQGLLTFSYLQLFKKLPQTSPSDDFIKIVTAQLLEATEEISVDEYFLGQILEILLSTYFDLSWPIISEKMIDPEFYGWYNLKPIFRYTKIKDNQLEQWMAQNPDTVPQIVIQLVPWKSKIDENVTWTPIVLHMLDRYSQNYSFISQLSSQIHSYSWSGSLVPHLEERLRLVEILKGHSSEQVRLFAENESKDLQSRIEHENRQDQNDSLR
ncbi:hypothetical protein AB6805_13820 [Chitinophaga sp. RCC_12]|uniref:hypothetical protein n=1 Tax=Chitinophaga sp. RCC_12 TaxID=3239226 RepID=UPI003525DC77